MKLSDMKCCVCGNGPGTDGRTLHRINAKGVPGIWACEQHIGQTDGRADPQAKKLTDLISGKASGLEVETDG